MSVTVYLNGCSGISDPTDIDGVVIEEGDKLTWDYGDSDEIKPWMREPVFIVERHKSGGLCAKGIDKPLYLHDFRFKYTRKICSEKEARDDG
jgi:hypothetical protein